MFGLRLMAGVSALMAMAGLSSAAAPLTGQWGGDRALLTLEATGGRIEYDCGSGTLDAALRPDAKGRFSVSGKHEVHTPGPTLADAAPAFLAASYRGTVQGDRMSLVVQVAGEKSPRTLGLVRGQGVKLVRCL